MRAVKPVVVGLLFWTAINLAPAGIRDWRMAALAAVSVAVLLPQGEPALRHARGARIGGPVLPLIVYAAVVPTQHFDPELPEVALASSELDERALRR